MNELHIEWLNQMYDAEIEETKGTIENERLFALGSTDEEETTMHESNIEDLEEYIELLEELKEQLEVY